MSMGLVLLHFGHSFMWRESHKHIYVTIARHIMADNVFFHLHAPFHESVSEKQLTWLSEARMRSNVHIILRNTIWIADTYLIWHLHFVHDHITQVIPAYNTTQNDRTSYYSGVNRSTQVNPKSHLITFNTSSKSRLKSFIVSSWIFTWEAQHWHLSFSLCPA